MRAPQRRQNMQVRTKIKCLCGSGRTQIKFFNSLKNLWQLGCEDCRPLVIHERDPDAKPPRRIAMEQDIRNCEARRALEESRELATVDRGAMPWER